MNKLIQDYIKAAMEILTGAEESAKDKKLPEVYKGYLSSLGASMRMSGLIPTLAFFSSKESSSKEDRWKVLDWIAEILQKNIPAYAGIGNAKSLFDYARQVANTDVAAKLEKDILDASVALKLSIRTFELSK
jgi:CRISPR type III-B/RAMP module-associated protein Cmr5